MALLTFDDGLVRLGGQILPGVLTSLAVRGAVRFDEQKVDGSSGKKKTPKGFEDADISVVLDLLTDDEGSDCYDKLAEINAVFRNVEEANPKVLDVDNRHLLARGIRQVVFSGLESAESDQNDVIIATLSFVEHNPPVIRLEKAAARAAVQSAGTVPAVNPAEKILAITVE